MELVHIVVLLVYGTERWEYAQTKILNVKGSKVRLLSD